jgi:hypothetical protein
LGLVGRLGAGGGLSGLGLRGGVNIVYDMSIFQKRIFVFQTKLNCPQDKMTSSLKQTIVDAALRVFHDPKYAEIEFKTAQVAREEFVKALIAELFPESPDMPNKKEEVEIPMLEEAMANLSIEDKPKEKKKPGPKPKPKPEGPVNIEKLNPTQTKKLKAASEGADKKAFLAYLNGLSQEEFDNKKFEDHINDFLTPKPKTVETELLEVEFEDETYLVDPNTKKVYKENGPVCEHVGDVGLAKFADMEI